MIALFTAILLAFATAASAQTTTLRDANGRITGTVTTDGNGQKTFRDGSGRMTGTANTDSNGTTTFRDGFGSDDWHSYIIATRPANGAVTPIFARGAHGRTQAS
jgi:YD repeat-containing protein